MGSAHRATPGYGSLLLFAASYGHQRAANTQRPGLSLPVGSAALFPMNTRTNRLLLIPAAIGLVLGGLTAFVGWRVRHG